MSHATQLASGVGAAFGATTLYYLGFAVFKVAADRMEPVRAGRPFQMAGRILGNGTFLGGLCLVLGGLALQLVALARIPLSVAVPIFVSGLVPLLLIAVVLFGERLAAREWVGLGLIAAAMLLLALSIGDPPPITATHVATWKLAVAVLPSIAVPFIIMFVGDYRPDGRHARRVAGIAYGLSDILRVAGFTLAVTAVLLFPRHERTEPALAPW